jgi:hypothetical protein
MFATATPSGQPSRCARTVPLETVNRRLFNIAVSLGLFAILVCSGYLAVHYRHEIIASLQAANVTAVRYETVGMLSVP